MNSLAASSVFYAIIAVFAIGATGALVLRRYDTAANIWTHCLATTASAIGLALSIFLLLKGSEPAFNVDSSFPLLTLSFRLDRLSVFFMMAITLIALLCSIYAFGYVRHYCGKYSIGVLGFFYNIFIASMILVVTAHNAIFFLMVWEIMSLSSYFLVIYERRQEANIKAGSLYFVMTHGGTAFIIICFLFIYKLTGSFDFGVMKMGMSSAPPLWKNAIFFSALVGFGAKAGIIPLHIWLPSAHPAAPSHISALMSGVMIKTGICMLIKIYFDILPDVYPWWGLLVLIIGSVSSLLGVLYALSEHDLKKLLAYHSIENIGIILLGLGSALVFSAYGLKTLAILGLAAALFHTLNHATFKALLFLGAGSVIGATGTRNIEKYGGLIRLMPQTTFFFLIGSMAISALPPLNGFFSEWLTFQALFQGVLSFDVMTKIIFILSIGSLAFTGGLAAACFVKAFGISFLARPRSEQAKQAKEAALPPRLAMAGLAAVIAGLGLFSGTVLGILSPVAAGIVNIASTEMSDTTGFRSASIQQGFASVSIPGVFAGLIAAGIIVVAAVYLVSRKRNIKTGRTWDCGSDLSPRMEITATAFSRSLIDICKSVVRPVKETRIEYHDANRYFPKQGSINIGLNDIYRAYIYDPIRNLMTLAAGQITRLQSGNVNVYILYIFVTLIGILLLLGIQS